MLKRILRRITNRFRQLFIKIAMKTIDLFPVNNRKIIYDNFNGSGYGGNPKYINDYLQTKKRFISIWLTKADYEFPSFVKPVKIGSLRAYYEASTARVRVTNIRNTEFPKKKKSQLHIQTWHASYSYKLIEKDIEYKLSPKYVEKAKYDGAITDAILVDSELQQRKFERCFWLNDHVEYLRFGLPRTDYLINCNNKKEVKQALFTKFELPLDSLLVLYAPTFRDDHTLTGYINDFEMVRHAIDNKFGKTVSIGVRFHPNAKKEFSRLNYQDVINFTDYSNMQELEIASDILITDYSSVMFDFAILHKPVFVCATDYEEYSKSRIRTEDYQNMPFPLAYSQQSLLYNIQTFDILKYNKTIEAFLEDNPIYSDGQSSMKIGEWVIQHIK